MSETCVSGLACSCVLDRLELAHLFLQGGDLALQVALLQGGHFRLGPIGAVERREIPGNARVDLGQAPLELGGREVLVPIVDGLELAAVDGHQRLGKEIQPAAQHDELAAHSADGRPVVLAEVGDGLEVGGEPPGEPHQLDIALRFALEPPARLDAVQIAVDIQLEQHRRVVAGASGGGRRGAFKPELPQVELLDERFDDTHRVVLGHIIVQARRQQGRLAAVLAFDESLHVARLAQRVAEVYEETLRFDTASASSRRSPSHLELPVSSH